MVRSVPRCAHCKRPMPGVSADARFCSDACALAFVPPPPTAPGAALAETLNVWRKRAAEPPPEPDATVTHWPRGTRDAASFVEYARNHKEATPEDAARIYKAWREKWPEIQNFVDATAFHVQAAAIGHATPPTPEPGEDAGFPCPSCDEPMIVLVREPGRVVIKCPACKVSETRTV